MAYKNIPLALVTAALVTAAATIAGITSGRWEPFAMTLGAGLAGWLARTILPDCEHANIEDVQDAFEQLLDAVRGHVRDHETRPYDPQAVTTQIASMRQMVTQMHEMLRRAGMQPEPEPDAAITVTATSAARKLASAHSLDLAKIPGTGQDGRVKIEDVQAFLVEPEEEAE